jgi:hypothetical protein
MAVLVYRVDWESQADPLTIFDDGPCLNLNKQGAKQRTDLNEIGGKLIKDCESNNEYDMVICQSKQVSTNRRNSPLRQRVSRPLVSKSRKRQSG